MKDAKIRELNDKQLSDLMGNAKARNDAEAQRVVRVAQEEIDRRKKMEKVRPANPLTWKQTGNRYACRVNGRRVANLTKIANHSNNEKDVYSAELNGKYFRHFERIKDAKEQIGIELIRRNIVSGD